MLSVSLEQYCKVNSESLNKYVSSHKLENLIRLSKQASISHNRHLFLL